MAIAVVMLGRAIAVISIPTPRRQERSSREKTVFPLITLRGESPSSENSRVSHAGIDPSTSHPLIAVMRATISDFLLGQV